MSFCLSGQDADAYLEPRWMVNGDSEWMVKGVVKFARVPSSVSFGEPIYWFLFLCVAQASC